MTMVTGLGPDFSLSNLENRLNKRIDELEKKIPFNPWTNELFFDARGGNCKRCNLKDVGQTIVKLADIDKNWKDKKKVDCQVSTYSIGTDNCTKKKEYHIEVKLYEL